MKSLPWVAALVASTWLLGCSSGGSSGTSGPTAKCYVDMGQCTCGGSAPSGAKLVDTCDSSYTTAPIACCSSANGCDCTSWKCEMVGQSCGCEYNGAPWSGADTCTGPLCCKRTNDSRGSCYCGPAGTCASDEEQVTQCSPGLTTRQCNFDETATSSCHS